MPMIFEDPSRRRWRLALTGAAVLGAAVGLLFIDLVAGLFSNPTLIPPPVEPRSRQSEMVRVLEREVAGPLDEETVKGMPVAAVSAKRTLQADRVVSAFVVQDDPASLASLQGVIKDLDIVFPDYLSFSKSDGSLVEHVNPAMQSLLAANAAMVMPRLSNTDAGGAWKADEVTELLRDYTARARLVKSVVESLERVGAQGVNVDIENLNPGDSDLFLDWLGELSAACRKKNLLVTVDLPVNDDRYDYEAVGGIADLVVLMAYDESYAGGKPGPVASNPWFTDAVSDYAKRIPPSKLIVAIGAYAYDWDVTGGNEAMALTFTQTINLAAEHEAFIATDHDTLNPRFKYKDERGHEHVVWMLDAMTAWNQTVVAEGVHARGWSIWRLGMEDPSLWKFALRTGAAGFDPRKLAEVTPLQTIESDGQGECYRVTQLPAAGLRHMTFDGRTIDYGEYTRLPSGYAIEKSGDSPEKLVALTFDDGPDPVWTPQILDILQELGVEATFFVVGGQAERFPGLVRRMADEGHLLGNHTFSHPNIQTISTRRLAVELNMTQRVIESITGRSTTLFRAPYDADNSPTLPAQLTPLQEVTRMGYVSIGGDIDSEDYKQPGVEVMEATVLKGLAKPGAHVIVLHDAGGEREQTVELVRKLIPDLQARGYRFVGVHELLDQQASAVMRPISATERAMLIGSDVYAWCSTTGWSVLVVVFFITTGVSVLRILGLIVLVGRGVRRDAPEGAVFSGGVTVLVPAYNEEKVIARTVEGVLGSEYRNIRVLVIDDGSTDGTCDEVRKIAARDGRVSLVTQSNSGKWAALNRGMKECDDEIVVTIDADTIVLPETVGRLVEPFADLAVDAVCGNVQVGNVSNVLTAFQDVEYVTSQNFDRRAFDSLNCISVVPGATGAWRRRSVMAVGGYSRNTLTEDADLTLTMLRAGARIVYAPEARSVTEAPQTVRSLFKQRFRWSFGTFQCLWKHKAAFLKGSLGWVALPNMLVFQILFPVLSPIGDVVLLLSLLRGDMGAVAVGYLTFLLMDLVGSLIAFGLDRRSPKSLWVVLIQRLFYRQFMYIVTFKSLIAAVRGGRHGWNKLDRSASVTYADIQPLAA